MGKNNRIQRRYRINETFSGENHLNFYVDITSGKGQTRVQIADISSTGVGFEIELSEYLGMDVQDNTEVQIKMFYPGGTISANAKVIWNFIIEADDLEIMKGGLMFTVLSPEQREKLSDLIDSFRKKSS
jgi:hypothetical protein